MRVLELYSGIGGMHASLKESGIKAEVIAAIDINTVANDVYKHNFSSTDSLNRNIQSLTPEFIKKLNVNAIFMSPPCQPFTRNGLKQDVADARSSSFLHVLSLLPQVNVDLILIENVRGFEKSEARDKLVSVLTDMQYNFKEFLLSPTEFGIPNSRQRYYCLARKNVCAMTLEMNNCCECYSIAMILEEDINVQDYLIPDGILRKRANILDICHSDSIRSCCFTKAYGHYIEGTGSVFTDKTRSDVDEVYAKLQCFEQDAEDYVSAIKQLNLRFFTPREVARLMGFPDTFTFPSSIQKKQCYRLLGNSINVKVVAELIKVLMS